MAHFAKLNSNNIVEQVIVISNNMLEDSEGNEIEQIGIDFCKTLYGSDTIWVQTSYNANTRKQYAGVGYTYDSTKDKFLLPQPFNSWVLDSDDNWQPPTPYPTDEQNYYWNEENLNWELITE
tara:strand:- start:90 stop:455 length:366 start_codon:yes stop_codon:yes gene_type:complete